MGNVEQAINKLYAMLRAQEKRSEQIETEYKAFIKACEDQPRSVTAEIDSIPGRRIYFNLVCEPLDFDANNAGQRGSAMNALVSQDGPFVQTHYPLATWKPSAPSNATNFGRWSPVTSWPLPSQEAANQDQIDLSYEVVSGGSQRNFQNLAAPPLFSRPDALMPLPVPTLFNPNEVIQFFPTFEDIRFDPDPANATTQGTLVVMLPGYRIVNL